MRAAFADYWLSYKLTFLTGERIIVAPENGVDRYPPYTAQVRTQPSCAANPCYNGTLLHTRYVFLALSLLCVAAPARAELVFFASGRTLNVKSHRTEGGSLVLTLRSGGEVVCDPALIARIAPDEAPYPEPVVEDSP